jgi:hypothetical protein
MMKIRYNRNININKKMLFSLSIIIILDNYLNFNYLNRTNFIFLSNSVNLKNKHFKKFI